MIMWSLSIGRRCGRMPLIYLPRQAGRRYPILRVSTTINISHYILLTFNVITSSRFETRDAR